MATKKMKTTKEAQQEILNIILQRAGLTKKNIHDVAEQDFVANNIGLLTPDEKQRYREIGLSL